MAEREGNTEKAARRVGRGVIGIIASAERLLMIRRAAGVAKAGYWCFPGGHIERGETSQRAIRRELREELGIDTVPFERVGSVRTSDAKYILAVWRVRPLSNDLAIAEDEVAEVAWLTPAQIRAITPNLQSNLQVLEMLGV
jgi:8-oxo-dGTP diphosphatase